MKIDQEKFKKILADQARLKIESQNKAKVRQQKYKDDAEDFILKHLEECMAYCISIGYVDNQYTSLFEKVEKMGGVCTIYSCDLVFQALRENGYTQHFTGFYSSAWVMKDDKNENLGNGGWFDDAKPPKKKIISWIENNWLYILFAITCFVFCHYLFA